MSELPERADVVVLGAGIVGCSAAYHLAAAGAGDVLVLDRADGPGRGSTGACAGGFRQQFTTEVNIRLSQASIPMILGFSEEHGIPVDVSQDGYLFLVRDEAGWERSLAAVERQRALGVPVETVGADDAETLIPGLAVADVVGATFGAADGIADPGALTQGYASIAARAGARFAYDVHADGIETRDGVAVGVRTTAGSVAASAVVLAAGAWSGALAATAGVDLPIHPVPRTIVTTGPFPGVPSRRTLVIDVGSSFYFHREQDGVLMGMAGADEPSFDVTVDRAWVDDALVPKAAAVFPPVLEAALRGSWAGLYEMTPDRHPVIGPAIDGLWIAAGFSGHGFQQGPVVGKLVAEMIVEGAARTVDVTAVRLERFAQGDLIVEGLVV